MSATAICMFLFGYVVHSDFIAYPILPFTFLFLAYFGPLIKRQIFILNNNHYGDIGCSSSNIYQNIAVFFALQSMLLKYHFLFYCVSVVFSRSLGCISSLKVGLTQTLTFMNQ